MDLTKNVPVLQEGGSTPATPTLLVISVVLLHTLYGLLNPLIPQRYVKKLYFIASNTFYINQMRVDH